MLFYHLILGSFYPLIQFDGTRHVARMHTRHCRSKQNTRSIKEKIRVIDKIKSLRRRAVERSRIKWSKYGLYLPDPSLLK